jgi:hypothetical protein
MARCVGTRAAVKIAGGHGARGANIVTGVGGLPMKKIYIYNRGSIVNIVHINAHVEAWRTHSFLWHATLVIQVTHSVSSLLLHSL